jgi:hypothetical protein
MVPKVKDAKWRDDDEDSCWKDREDTLFEEDGEVESTRQVRAKVVVVAHDGSISSQIQSYTSPFISVLQESTYPDFSTQRAQS